MLDAGNFAHELSRGLFNLGRARLDANRLTQTLD